MQATTLKFEGIWILLLQILEFKFYLQNLGSKIQTSKILEDKIQILKCQDIKSKDPKILGGGLNPNSEILGYKIQTS